MKRTYPWPLIIVCAVAMISLALVGDARLSGQSGDVVAPPAEAPESFFFHLELEGQGVAGYDECYGLGSSNEIEELTTQTGSVIVKQKTPGALEWHTITLKRTGPSDTQVWSWRKAMEDGTLDEAIRDGAIVMIGTGASGLVARWDFHRGWPASLTFDGFVETLMIVHDGLERVEPSLPPGGNR